MGTGDTDNDRAEESARADADDAVVAPGAVTPEVAPPNPPESDDCSDPGPGRDPRPDLRGA